MKAPFHDWASMIRMLRNIQKSNDDAVILIDGDEGAGKSTLAFRLCNVLEDNWDPETRVIIDYEDWLERYGTRERNCAYLLDEGGNLAFSRDAATRENKHIVKILQMARILNNIVVVCCPNAQWLDKYLREHRALIYIHVQKLYHKESVLRGKAVVNWKIKHWSKISGQGNLVEWRGVFDLFFPAMPKDDPVWREYERVKIDKIQRSAAQLSEKARG